VQKGRNSRSNIFFENLTYGQKIGPGRKRIFGVLNGKTDRRCQTEGEGEISTGSNFLTVGQISEENVGTWTATFAAMRLDISHKRAVELKFGMVSIFDFVELTS